MNRNINLYNNTQFVLLANKNKHTNEYIIILEININYLQSPIGTNFLTQINSLP